MHAFRCSVVVQFVNIIRSLRIVQWSNKLQLPPQIRNVGPFYDLFLFIHASRLCSSSFGSLRVISNELEREECSWVSTAFVLDFDTGNMTSFANKTHAIFHWRIDWSLMRLSILLVISVGACVIFVVSTEHKISLLYRMTRKCGDMLRLFH